MYRTRSRDKIPQDFSFPIGIELINTACEDLGELPVLEVRFTWLSKLRVAAKNSSSNPVLRATFVRWDKRPSLGNEAWVQDYLAGKWSLDVYPVLRVQRSVVRRLLVQTGIPALMAWLASDRQPSWYFGRKVWEATFSSGNESLGITEREEAV